METTAADKMDNSGPLENRIKSKDNKVREYAYVELTKMCQDAQHSCKDDFRRKHAKQWSVYLQESNVMALEKCLDCFTAYLDKVHPYIILQHKKAIIQVLVEKCLGHSEPVIRNKSSECFLMLFEVTENFDDSYFTLTKLISHENIKVLTTAILAVASLIEHFSISKTGRLNYHQQMLKNAKNTDPECKAAVYQYYKAHYKWVGNKTLIHIDQLEEQQIEELKKLFEEVKATNDKSIRLFRSEKAAEEENKIKYGAMKKPADQRLTLGEKLNEASCKDMKTCFYEMEM